MAAVQVAKPQDTDPVSTKPVQKGDSVAVSAEFLTAVPIPIEWSQQWQTRKQTYYYVVFENGATDKGRLFINEASLDLFKKLPVLNGKYTFKIDEEFQYGQANKDGKDRFLVFHNKNNTPYQHRFVTSLWIKLGHKLGEIVGDVGPGAVKGAAPTVEKQLLAAFGDPLRNF